MAAMPRIRIAIVGLGKIARDQHLPALAANDQFELIAVASPHSAAIPTPTWTDRRRGWAVSSRTACGTIASVAK